MSRAWRQRVGFALACLVAAAAGIGLALAARGSGSGSAVAAVARAIERDPALRQRAAEALSRIALLRSRYASG